MKNHARVLAAESRIRNRLERKPDEECYICWKNRVSMVGSKTSSGSWKKIYRAEKLMDDAIRNLEVCTCSPVVRCRDELCQYYVNLEADIERDNNLLKVEKAS